MHRVRGISLFEILVVVTILAVLAAIAVPNFSNMLKNGKVAAASNALLADLNYARTEAVVRGSFIAICPSTDGTSCTTSNVFDQGWIVYRASAVDAVHASTDPPVLRYATRRVGVSMLATVAKGNVITFGQQGHLDGAQAPVPQGTMPAKSNLTFVTCLVGSSGSGQSTGTIPGIQLQVLGIGSPATATLAAGASCSS